MQSLWRAFPSFETPSSMFMARRPSHRASPATTDALDSQDCSVVLALYLGQLLGKPSAVGPAAGDLDC